MVDLIAIDSIAVDEDNNLDKIGNSKVNGTKVGAKTTKSKNQDKSKSKNLIKFFAKALAQTSGSSFLTPGLPS